MPTVGVLRSVPDADHAAILEELRAQGWRDGENINVVPRDGDECYPDIDDARAVLRRWVADGVDVIIAYSTPHAQLAIAVRVRAVIAVRAGRLELPSPEGHQVLSLARLPVPPRSRGEEGTRAAAARTLPLTEAGAMYDHIQRSEQHEVVAVMRSEVSAEFVAATLAAHGVPAVAVECFGYPSVDFVQGVRVTVASGLAEEARAVLFMLGGHDPPGVGDG